MGPAMGKAAKRKRQPPSDLPESWTSPAYGIVHRNDFKGCLVLAWDFLFDEPLVLLDKAKKQLHFSQRHFDREDVLVEIDKFRKLKAPDLEIEQVEETLL